MRRRRSEPGFPKYLFIITAVLFLSVVFSLFAKFNWFFDLFSHFTLQYIVASAIMSLVLFLYKKGIPAFVAIVICVFEISKLYPLIIKENLNESAKYDVVNVLQFNVNKNNNNIDEIARWIISMSEDLEIVVLFEVNNKWDEALRRIKWTYPYSIRKDVRGGREIVVFSRLYIDELEVKYLGEEKAPAIVLRGETTGYEMPFVLYAMHPPPPVLPSAAKRRNDLLVSAAASIATEPAAHKFMVADFNTTRFSPWFRKIEALSGLHDSNEGIGLEAYRTTWPKYFTHYFGLTLDNILISDNIVVARKEIGSSMGSDHYPVLTNLRFIKEKKK